MKEFKVGEIETFAVVGIRDGADERKYIYLSDGEKETYRVRPFDFQLEWEDSNRPKVMQCVVTDVNVWGLPTLAQLRYNVLSECYAEPQSEYSFKLIEIREDINSNAIYYNLKDPFGLVHRYYPTKLEKLHEVSDIFSLVFDGIQEKDNNTDYLLLSPVDEVVSQIEDIFFKVDLFEPDSIDPRNDSLFGREDDTTEFKTSIVYPADGTKANIDKQLMIIAKTIAGFQNRNGGKLYIGVNDSGNTVGINSDYEHLETSEYDKFTYQKNIDGYENKIRNSIKYLLGAVANSNIMLDFKNEGAIDYCVITINKVLKPIFLNGNKLYERTGQLTQLLTDDAIVWFIEQRMMERNNIKLSETKDYKTEVSEEEMKIESETVIIESTADTNFSTQQLKLEDTDIIKHFASEPTTTDRIYNYITFYKNGQWSFQNMAIANDTVEYELPIMYSLRRERLVICYDNGRINVVNPYLIIKEKTANRMYQNGWNTNAKIISVFNLHSNDLLAFTSKDGAGAEYVKIHHVNAISVHQYIYSEGNLLINEKYAVKIISVKPILQKYQHFVSSLIFKNNQRSSHIGYKRSERNFQNVYRILESIY